MNFQRYGAGPSRTISYVVKKQIDEAPGFGDWALEGLTAKLDRLTHIVGLMADMLTDAQRAELVKNLDYCWEEAP